MQPQHQRVIGVLPPPIDTEHLFREHSAYLTQAMDDTEPIPGALPPEHTQHNGPRVDERDFEQVPVERVDRFGRPYKGLSNQARFPDAAQDPYQAVSETQLGRFARLMSSSKAEPLPALPYVDTAGYHRKGNPHPDKLLERMHPDQRAAVQVGRDLRERVQRPESSHWTPQEAAGKMTVGRVVELGRSGATRVAAFAGRISIPGSTSRPAGRHSRRSHQLAA